jgi:hypothetical protein
MPTIPVDDYGAQDFKDLSEKYVSEERKDEIINQCILSKLIGDIRFEVAINSFDGLTSCNVSISHNMLPASKEILEEVMDYIRGYFEVLNFDVTIKDNIISLDWSNVDAEYMEYARYQNMHKQGKKQHAPRKHNLKVIK